MGVQTIEEQNYISFSIEGEYGQQSPNGMAWGIKTKSDGKFQPILYIKNFETGDKDTDGGYGELVLSSCNLVLSGEGTGMQSGQILMHGDPGGDSLYFEDTNGNTLMWIVPENIFGEYGIYLLNEKISFYQNKAGSNSFKLGNDNENYCLFTDDGSIYGKFLGLGNNLFINSDGEVTGELKFYSIPSYQGNPLVYGKGHDYFLKWTGSQLQFWVDTTNVGTLSDKRLKKEIQDIDNDFIELISEIETKQFKVANRNGLISFGIMAQDLIELFRKYKKNPFEYEIVYETQYKTDDETIYYAVNYEQFLLLKQRATDFKMKKIQEEIEKKDIIINNLISRIERLEASKCQ